MPHHIVIVEDEPVTQARLQSYFTQEGYTVSRYGERCWATGNYAESVGRFNSAGYQLTR
ncbi:two-component response regulator [Escherichia coli]|nr:two-component response regulator [Escherichia coli]